MLAPLGAQAYSVEIDKGLADSARKRLEQLGHGVKMRLAHGYVGWPEAAPLDGIIVNAAPPAVPAPLHGSSPGGILVISLGEGYQDLLAIGRTSRGYAQQDVLPVRLVPRRAALSANDRACAQPSAAGACGTMPNPQLE